MHMFTAIQIWTITCVQFFVYQLYPNKAKTVSLKTTPQKESPPVLLLDMQPKEILSCIHEGTGQWCFSQCCFWWHCWCHSLGESG